MTKKNKTSTALVIYLAALGALPPMSTDIYLSSMPIIGKLMQTDNSHVQLTLSLFFISFALLQLIWGPLSDRFGRKSITLVGLGIFIASSLGCALSTHIATLIFFRITQAIGACAGSVMTFAIARDRFSDKQTLARALSITISVMFVAPMVAPIIGSYLLTLLNWQANFYFVSAYGLILLIASLFSEESYPKDRRQPLPAHQLLHAYAEQLKSRPFLLTAIAVATNFSVIFAFISSSPFVYIDIFKIAKQHFGYFFALNASALILSNWVFRRLQAKHISSHVLLPCALAIALLGAVSMFATLPLWPNSAWSIAIPCFIASFGTGALYAEIMALALHHTVKHAGLTSALVGSVRFALAGLTSALMGTLIHNNAEPLAWVMTGLILITIACMIIYRKMTLA